MGPSEDAGMGEATELPLSYVRTHFSAVVKRVEAGESILVTKFGVPAARIEAKKRIEPVGG